MAVELNPKAVEQTIPPGLNPNLFDLIETARQSGDLEKVDPVSRSYLEKVAGGSSLLDLAQESRITKQGVKYRITKGVIFLYEGMPDIQARHSPNDFFPIKNNKSAEFRQEVGRRSKQRWHTDKLFAARQRQGFKEYLDDPARLAEGAKARIAALRRVNSDKSLTNKGVTGLREATKSKDYREVIKKHLESEQVKAAREEAMQFQSIAKGQVAYDRLIDQKNTLAKLNPYGSRRIAKSIARFNDEPLVLFRDPENQIDPHKLPNAVYDLTRYIERASKAFSDLAAKYSSDEVSADILYSALANYHYDPKNKFPNYLASFIEANSTSPDDQSVSPHHPQSIERAIWNFALSNDLIPGLIQAGKLTVEEVKILYNFFKSPDEPNSKATHLLLFRKLAKAI